MCSLTLRGAEVRVDCAIETRQSISCMDIRVTARVGVLAAIGNACKQPFDGLLIMKWGGV
jgi:hypothetical protein